VTATLSTRRSTVAIVRVCAAAAAWGLGAIFAKHGFDHGIPPARMAAARVLVALVVLISLLAWRRRDLLRLPRRALPLLIAFGTSVSVVNLSYYVAIDRLAVGVAISLQYTGPVLVLLWTAVVTRRSPTPLAWVAGGVTLVGAILVSQALEADARLDPLGLAAALLAAVTFGTTLLTAEALAHRDVHPASVLVWGFATGVVIWSVVQPWWSFPVSALADPGVVVAVLGVGLVGTLIPFFLEVGAVKVLPAAVAGIAATSEPVFASGFAWLLLGQALAPGQIAGGVITIAGVALAQVSEGRRLAAVEAAATSATPPRTAAG
jgi:drug/metabolite transporter (DMT)-like permease